MGWNDNKTDRIVTMGGIDYPVTRGEYNDALKALQVALVNTRAIAAAAELAKAARLTASDVFIFLVDETSSMWDLGDELTRLTTELPVIFNGTDFQKTAFSQIATFSLRRQAYTGAEFLGTLTNGAIREVVPLTAARNSVEMPSLNPAGATPLFDAVYSALYSGYKSAQAIKKATKRPVRRISLKVFTDGEHTGGVIVPADVKALADHIKKEGFNLEFDLFALQRDLDTDTIEAQTALAATLGGGFAHGSIADALGLVVRSSLMRNAYLTEFAAPSAAALRTTGYTGEFVDLNTGDETAPGN